MLKIENLSAGYQEGIVLKELSVRVEAGEVVALVGRNGAGKSTLIKSILGQTKIHSGVIELQNENLASIKPFNFLESGIGVALQGSHTFPELTVQENLRLSSHKPVSTEEIKEVLAKHFPQLLNKRIQIAGSLSGGEQQMLALARLFIANPDVILLDEPTEGLMPTLVDLIGEKILELKDKGKSILLAEQNLKLVSKVADRFYALENGQIVDEGSISEDAELRLEAALKI